MKLTYGNANRDFIKVELGPNNVLGNFRGPVSINVPTVPDNKEYAEIVSKGYTIQPFTPTDFVPHSVTPLQARKALRQAGLMESFSVMMNQASEEIQEEWQYANSIERSNYLIAQFANDLGLSETDVDNLFVLASTL